MPTTEPAPALPKTSETPESVDVRTVVVPLAQESVPEIATVATTPDLVTELMAVPEQVPPTVKSADVTVVIFVSDENVTCTLAGIGL